MYAEVSTCFFPILLNPKSINPIDPIDPKTERVTIKL